MTGSTPQGQMTDQSDEADPTPPDAPEFPYWRRNSFFLGLGAFHNTLGFTAFFPFLPFMVREFGIEGNLESLVGLLVGSFFAFSVVMGPIWGGLADHFGRKSMVLRAGWGMSLTFVLLALAPNWWFFLAFFMLLGITNGYVPAAMIMAATNTPRNKMGRAISTLHTGALLGTTFGPAIGALLATLLPAYRQLFWVGAFTSFVSGSLTWYFVKEKHTRPTEPFRLHLIEDARKILRYHRMRLLLGVSFVLSLTFFGSTTVVALYTLELAGGAQSLDGLSIEAWVGLVSLALTISSALAVPFWGRLLDRYEPGRMMALGLLLGVLSLLPFPFVQSPLQLAICRAILGLLAVGSQPAVVRLIKDNAPRGMDARALALSTSMMMLGNGGGPLLAGLIGPWLGLRVYFALNGILLLLSLCAWVLWGMRMEDGERAVR